MKVRERNRKAEKAKVNRVNKAVNEGKKAETKDKRVQAKDREQKTFSKKTSKGKSMTK